MFGAIQDGRETSITAMVGTAPRATDNSASSSLAELGNLRQDRQQLGLLLTAVDPASGPDTRGARVASIDPGGLAAARGISPGDVILDVANRPVTTPDEVYRSFADAQKAGKRSLLLRVKSGETARFIAVPIG